MRARFRLGIVSLSALMVACGGGDDPLTDGGQPRQGETSVFTENFSSLTAWNVSDIDGALKTQDGWLIYSSGPYGTHAATLVSSNSLYLTQLQPDVNDWLELRARILAKDCGGWTDVRLSLSLDGNSWTPIFSERINGDGHDMSSAKEINLTRDISGWQDKTVLIRIQFNNIDYYEDNVHHLQCEEGIGETTRIDYVSISRVYQE